MYNARLCCFGLEVNDD